VVFVIVTWFTNKLLKSQYYSIKTGDGQCVISRKFRRDRSGCLLDVNFRTEDTTRAKSSQTTEIRRTPAQH